MIKIDLSRYVQTGEGATACTYESLLDPGFLVKLYHPSINTHVVEVEHDMARKVFELGIPSPEPGDIVTDGSRIGLRFRKVEGKRSFARAISQEPERISEYAREFAICAKGLHSVECPEGLFPNVKDDILDTIHTSHCLDERRKNRAKEFLTDKVPDCHLALHGDLHYGNLLMTLAKGEPLTAPHEYYFIDLASFSYGCPLIDLGMTYNIAFFAPEDFLMENMHYGRKISEATWEPFAKEYFFGSEQLGKKWFGPDADMARVNREMYFYSLFKLLFVEYVVGEMPDYYTPIVKDIIDAM